MEITLGSPIFKSRVYRSPACHTVYFGTHITVSSHEHNYAAQEPRGRVAGEGDLLASVGASREAQPGLAGWFED
jgi:hypothetical protein